MVIDNLSNQSQVGSERQCPETLDEKALSIIAEKVRDVANGAESAAIQALKSIYYTGDHTHSNLVGILSNVHRLFGRVDGMLDIVAALKTDGRATKILGPLEERLNDVKAMLYSGAENLVEELEAIMKIKASRDEIYKEAEIENKAFDSNKKR